MLENSSCDTMSNPSHLRCSAICSGTSLNLMHRVTKKRTKFGHDEAVSVSRVSKRPMSVALVRGGGGYYMMQLTIDSAPSHFRSEKRVVA